MSVQVPPNLAWLTDRYWARAGEKGREMSAKGRFILAALMSSMMVFMVTLLVTYLNLGLRTDFLWQWVKAYVIAWPVAATTAFLVMPMAQRATGRILAKLEGKT